MLPEEDEDPEACYITEGKWLGQSSKNFISLSFIDGFNTGFEAEYRCFEQPTSQVDIFDTMIYFCRISLFLHMLKVSLMSSNAFCS